LMVSTKGREMMKRGGRDNSVLAAATHMRWLCGVCTASARS